MPESKILTSEYLEKLYSKNENDEKIIRLEDAPGLTIIKKYPSKYNKEDYRMFVRFYILEGNLVFGGANMMEEQTRYVREDKKFTNFTLQDSDKIIFDTEKDRIIIKRLGLKKKFTVNQFVSLLTKNHLKNRHLWKEIKKNTKLVLLKILFWFADEKYNWGDFQDRMYRDNTENRFHTQLKEKILPTVKDPEPFFKYFRIHRNTLLFFMVLLVAFLFFGLNIYTKSLMCWNSCMEIFSPQYFSVSNPIILLLFFISLSVLHYFSEWITKTLNNKSGRILKMHNSLINHTFKLKL